MAIRNIVMNPSPILQNPCQKVTKFDAQLSVLLDDMYDTMLEFDGVGIAAPQVNEALQVAIVELGEEGSIVELVNPEIIEMEGSAIEVEGCLSLPNLYGEVERANYVHIRAQDRHGECFEIEAAEFDARVILHEMDHLHGVLFDSKIIRVVSLEELEEELEEQE